MDFLDYINDISVQPPEKEPIILNRGWHKPWINPSKAMPTKEVWQAVDELGSGAKLDVSEEYEYLPDTDTFILPRSALTIAEVERIKKMYEWGEYIRTTGKFSKDP